MARICILSLVSLYCLCQGLETSAQEQPSALISAVKSSNQAQVLSFIDQGVDINVPEADGTTALHWAIQQNNGDLINVLLAKNANVNASNRYGVTPLQIAAVNGDVSVIASLLNLGADPNVVLPEGETILMTAARTGVAEVLQVLLAQGAEIDARENWYGESALMWSAAENHGNAITVLVEHGADVNSRSALQEPERRRAGQSILPLGSWTSMMYAARENALDAAAALVNAGADLDLVDPDGATALVIAIINSHYEFAEFLLRSGADPNVVDNAAGMGPLYAAVDMHRLAIGHGRGNPLQLGRLDSVDIVRLLLQYGADPNARLKQSIIQRQHTAGDSALGEGATALMRAAKSGDIAMVRVLLEGGATPDLTLPDGTNALMFAAGLGWRNGSPLAPSYDQGSEAEAIETIELLLSLGFDINAVNDAGVSALHGAVSGRGSALIVKFLLEQGADVTLANERQQTPLIIAEARSTAEIVSLLRDSR